MMEGESGAIWRFAVIALLASALVAEDPKTDNSTQAKITSQYFDRKGRDDFDFSPQIYSPPEDGYFTDRFYSPDGYYKGGIPTYSDEPKPSTTADAPETPSPAPPVSDAPAGFDDYLLRFKHPGFSGKGKFPRFHRHHHPHHPHHRHRHPHHPLGDAMQTASVPGLSVWKGDSGAQGGGGGESSTGGGHDFGQIHAYHGAWKGDPWTADKMAMMMMMKEMHKETAPGGDKKKGGFLSKLISDPSAIAIAAMIPLSLIIVAVLPLFVNMVMQGHNIPTFTTTATGDKGRALDSHNSTAFLSPALEAIFSAKNIVGEPQCFQRFFCQVTKNGETRSLQKAFYRASQFVDDYYLDAFGLKTLVESLHDGDCDKLPCTSRNATSSEGSESSKDDGTR